VALTGETGKGTTVVLRLPLTLALIEGLAVGAGGETFVLPLDQVIECVEMPAGAEDGGDGGNGRASGLIDLRGEPVPYLRLREHFELGAPGGRARENVVVVECGEGRAGLAVDAVHGRSQTVIKPLGRLFGGVQGISGSAILGNGRVALILDVPALLREAVRSHEALTV
jgi:two-component system chemotaxis sensor kinase CheA